MLYAGDLSSQYKMMEKKTKNLLKPLHVGSHLRVPGDNYPMITNMTGFRWFSKIFASLFYG